MAREAVWTVGARPYLAVTLRHAVGSYLEENQAGDWEPTPMRRKTDANEKTKIAKKKKKNHIFFENWKTAKLIV